MPETVQYLNNVLEQDHRAIKRRIRASQHFRSFWGAWRTIAGYEAIHMIRKGQALRKRAGGEGRSTPLLHSWFVQRGDGLILRTLSPNFALNSKVATLPSRVNPMSSTTSFPDVVLVGQIFGHGIRVGGDDVTDCSRQRFGIPLFEVQLFARRLHIGLVGTWSFMSGGPARNPQKTRTSFRVFQKLHIASAACRISETISSAGTSSS